MTQISIRAATPDDASAIRAIYAPIVENSVISFEEAVPSVEDMAARIGNTLKAYPYLAAERNGQVVGFASAGRHEERAAYRWSVRVSVYVAEGARQTGVGRALYGQLLPGLAAQGFHAAFAGISLPNPASVALHEAMGFESLGVARQVGFKFGRWRDVGWWQRLLGAGAAPAEPGPPQL